MTANFPRKVEVDVTEEPAEAPEPKIEVNIENPDSDDGETDKDTANEEDDES